MSEDSISLAETNKIRISLGLNPIPETESKPQKSHIATNTESVNSSEESLNLEDTNRIRKSLGLKPIENGTKYSGESTVESISTASEQDELARKNWLEKYNNEKRLVEQDRIRKRIEQINEEARRRRLAEGRGIAETNDKESTSGWLKQFHEKQRHIQEKRIQDEEEALAVSQPNKIGNKRKKPTYSSKNLKGLKVGHSMAQLDSLDHDVVLTLKDTSVLEDEEPELVAEELISRQEDAKIKIEKAANKRGYNNEYTNDDDMEFDGKEKKYLSKYDDENNSAESFILGGEYQRRPVEKKPTSTNEKEPLKVSLSFDEIIGTEPSNTASGDYEVKFKKPKKLKSKKESTSNSSTKRKRFIIDDDDEKRSINQDLLVDDEDFQSALLLNRRKVQKLQQAQFKKPSSEELAEKLLAENNDSSDSHLDFKNDSNGNQSTNNLVISEMSDFLEMLKRRERETATDRPLSSTRPNENFDIDNSLTIDTPGGLSESEIKNSDIQTDDPDLQSTDLQSVSESTSSVLHDETESLTLSSGLGDTLKLLQAKGTLTKQTEEEKERIRLQKEQRQWALKAEKEKLLRDLNLKIEKERLRKEGRYDQLTARTKELLAAEENHQRQQQEAIDAAKRFANYKPDINLRYHDENGNALSVKEAYKHLSHQFHGTAPGKNKIDKQIKRRQEEAKRESRSVFEVDTSETSVTQKNAGVRLL